MMLESIKVSGFRSLNGFEISLTRGLNVLVGPNGAGKSNILDFLLFLSEFSTRSLEDAIGKSSGAGAVFTRNSLPDEQRILSFELTGFNEINRERSVSNLSVQSKYEYRADIVFEPVNGLLYIQKQEIKLFLKSKTGDYTKKDLFGGITPDLHIKLALDEDKNLDLKIERLDLRKLRLRPIFSLGDKEQVKKVDVLKRYCSHIDECCLTDLSMVFPQLISVLNDMDMGQVFNVSPASARLTSDIGREASISPSGAGLPSLVWAFERAEHTVKVSHRNFMRRGRYGAPIRRRFPVSSIHDLKSLVKMVNPEILDIRTEREIYDNELKLIYVVASSEGTIDLPATLMSDGTTKWTALMAAILSRQSIFAIEEPENFLHPRMLEVLLGAIRNQYAQKHSSSFLIVTTHSQTFLDLCDPTDVIIVSMKGGKSTARRIEDPEMVQDEINSTGFGLGHFYLTGLLDN